MLKYARVQDEVVPAAKCARLNTWQAYMKNFGQTNGRFTYIVALYYNYLLAIYRRKRDHEGEGSEGVCQDSQLHLQNNISIRERRAKEEMRSQ